MSKVNKEEVVFPSYMVKKYSKAMLMYIGMFGMNDMIPKEWFAAKGYNSVDEIYSECVKRGITWRELTGWNDDENPEIEL